ncbi:alkene reductase [Mesonia sp. K7]|uniref:alkene reductase n=1 Tax=Mesonia sp. K7 TaxID=2218606 RepID=UPI000DA8FB40|nr:alkene reductase [Mesonia sp. K7]PZD79221.1 alkene reductase [Mesonia sp. K7]
MSKQPLLKPFDLNGISLKNRVVMAPLTRNRVDNTEMLVSKDLHGKYYQQRYSAGLIITEGVAISPKSVGYSHIPGIFTKEQTEAWKEVTKMVHDKGGKIFMQLWHVGRNSHPDFHDGELPWAPSAINPNIVMRTPNGKQPTVTPKEMTLADIKQTIEEYKTAAVNAMAAGFDGVEIHASNGYLLHQFFVTSSNHRNDMYGGNEENRSRILFDILKEIKKEVPLQKVGVRLNPSLHGIFGIDLNIDTIPTFDYIIKKLNAYDLAYLHLSEPFNDVSEVPYAITQIAERYRPIYKRNLMINAHFDQKKGNEVLQNKLADLVAYGKAFISNPDLVERFEKNIPLTHWDTNTFYTLGKKGYTDYPILGRKEAK